VKKCEDMITHFDTIHKHDRHTPHEGKGRTCTTSRGKNLLMYQLKIE